jgi:hypothetical protein
VEVVSLAAFAIAFQRVIGRSAMGAQLIGYVTTSIHLTMALAQLVAAFAAAGDR